MAANRMRVSLIALLLMLLSGCIAQTQPIVKLALLAPFEGRYRDTGYQALYAARLALAESNTPQVQLLAIDDGGSVATARDRAQAIQNDPAIVLTIASGSFATAPDVQREFTETPLLIVGHYGTQPIAENIYQLAHEDIASRLTLPENSGLVAAAQIATETDAPLIGHEMFALESFALLLAETATTEADVRVLSSGLLPDADFTARYQSADSFAPEPGLLAPLTYDATRLALQSITQNTPLSVIQYTGYHGDIAFNERGFWQNAPLYEYRYQNGILIPAADNS